MHMTYSEVTVLSILMQVLWEDEWWYGNEEREARMMEVYVPAKLELLHGEWA